jgi:ankyrin repeat protein
MRHRPRPAAIQRYVRSSALAGFAALALTRASSADDAKEEALFGAIRTHDARTVATMVARDSLLVGARMKMLHWSPLHVAVVARDTAIVGLLIRRGANLQATDDYGSSPLHFSVSVPEDSTRALRARCRYVERQLLAAGARVDMPDRNGATTLHWAATKGDSAFALTLIRAGADVNAVAIVGGWTPLLGATAKGDRAMVRLLVRNGARLDLRDAKGRTPLIMAGQMKQEAVAGLLRQLGARE